MGAVGTAAGDGTGGEGEEMGREAGAGSTGTLGTGSAHSQGTAINSDHYKQKNSLTIIENLKSL